MIGPGARDGWSVADAQGVQSCVLDRQHRHRLRRSVRPAQSGALTAWPTEWRDLLMQWLRNASTRRSWTSLLKIAGNARYVLAHDLLEALLETGWILLDERRERDRWQAHHLDWLAADDLREALKLERHDARAQVRSDALAQLPLDERLHVLHASMTGLTTPSMLRRTAIVHALDRWAASQRSGTRQQFALHALADTKGLRSSEWQWLTSHVDLEELGISRHAPTLWLRAPLRLCRDTSVLDLRMVPDMIGLSPLTLGQLDAIEGDINAWLLLENRTSFEQVARGAGHHYGVLWLPGFAPDWWLQTVDQLLRLLPRPALIAADPDPAGIDIALRAGALWQAHTLDWQPWAMDEATLAALTQHKPLNDYDRDRLVTLLAQPMPVALRQLAEALARENHKGEQEGIDLLALLPALTTAKTPS